MRTSDGLGRVYRRCGCRDEETGKQFGGRCERLADLSHGRWYFSLQVPAVDGGRDRVRRGGFATLAEAERACWELSQLPGPEAVARTWTVRRWLHFWLSELEGRLRPTTVLNYRSVVEKYLIPHLGFYRLSKLRTKTVQRAMDAICRQVVRGGRLISPGSVSRIRAVLRSALSEARRQGIVGHNPARNLRLPNGARPHAVVWDDEHEAVWRETGVRPRVAVWDLDNLARFLEAVRDDPLFVLWWLVALRGPRRGEMAGLRWEDINLAAGELTIREQVIVIGGREHLGPPKSAAGVRTLALDEATVKLLWELWHEQRRRRGGVDPKGRVFVHANGRPVSPDWLTRRFAKLVKQLGLPPVRLHDLRHAAAGLASAAGVDLKMIQHDMGHASPVTTAETYIYVFKKMAKEAVRASAELLLSHAKIRMSLEGASQA
ncbi:site-specific integrase [Micromonospora sp. 4G55]|uniref:tyrosine-type recombinase/integrase n=1 Tax=Micromonospora sp. 4G55 TaxID=2806102 RepID=UPI001EE4920C|nr:site-specific integrase [Micromonospora sp. 4G55]